MTTNAAGNYALDPTGLNGDYVIKACKEGYLTKDLNIRVIANNAVYLDLWLEATKKPPVEITVDAGAQTPVRMIFGDGEFVIDAPVYYRFNDPVYIAALKDSGAKIMRFPGGTMANFYDWEKDQYLVDVTRSLVATDLLPRDEFANAEEYKAMVAKLNGYFGQWAGKGAKSNTVRGKYGYADFLDMTRRIGAEISYVGNVSRCRQRPRRSFGSLDAKPQG